MQRFGPNSLQARTFIPTANLSAAVAAAAALPPVAALSADGTDAGLAAEILALTQRAAALQAAVENPSDTSTGRRLLAGGTTSAPRGAGAGLGGVCGRPRPRN